MRNASDRPSPIRKMIRSCTLPLCALALSFAACGPGEEAARELDVNSLVEAGDIAAAIDRVSEALRDDSRNVDLLYNFALLQRIEGDYDEAKRNARRALELSPDDSEVMLLMAELNLLQGDSTAALESLNQLNNTQRNKPRALYLASLIHMRQGDWRQAEASLRNARSSGDDSALTQAALAYVLIKQSETDQARGLLEQAEASAAGRGDAVKQIAECYLEFGQAQKALQLAQSMNPEERRDADLWALIGRAQLALLNLGEAESAFTRALVCPNAGPEHRIQYAEMLFAAEREDEAMTHALKAESDILGEGRAMRTPSLYNLLATLYARRGQILPAHKYLSLSLQIDPTQPKAAEILQRLESGSSSEPENPSETAEPEQAQPSVDAATQP